MVAALAGLVGLAVGSFLNVVAYRVPLGGSLTTPPSSCPSCGSRIRPRDNIPIVSWLLLAGRCRDCRAGISVRYPMVEAGTAALFAATTLVVGLTWTLPAYLWFAGATLVLVLTDFDHQRIPNRILYPSVVAGTLLLFGGSLLESALSAMGRALAGGLLYFAVLLVIALAARGGFGFGDVKLGFLLGEFLAFRSWGTLGAGVFLAFAVGGLVAVLLLVTGRRGRKDAIPFGPALVLGAWLAIPLGDALVAWYLG